jgi:hypothetical protein
MKRLYLTMMLVLPLPFTFIHFQHFRPSPLNVLPFWRREEAKSLGEHTTLTDIGGVSPHDILG